MFRIVCHPMRHLPQLGGVARRKQHKVRNEAQEANVESTMMGGTIVADKSRTVHKEANWQILDRDIVQNLVKSSLQERGVDGAKRLDSGSGHTGRERDGVLFGDADVVIPLRKLLGEPRQPGSVGHCSRNRYNRGIGFSTFDRRVSKGLRVRDWSDRLRDLLAFEIEGRDAVPLP